MVQFGSACIFSALLVSSYFNLQQPSATKQPNPTTKAEGPILPPNFFLEKEPESAKSVEDVKASAKAGEKVTVRGRIGGSVSPFVEGRAVFTLMGSGLKACSDNPEDMCKVPWDYCCETPEAIARHSATVQVVDAAGNPLRTGLKGAHGLKELSEVIVQGTVKEAKDKVLIINAKGLYIVPPKNLPPKKEDK